MTRIFGHFIALEMLGLWLVEFVPCMLALYIFLLPGGGSGWADVDALGHATTLALAISAVWVAVGLYQPEVCQENWRLFLGSAVGGLLTLPAVVAMDYLLRLNVTGVLGASAMRPVQFVLTWIAFLFATRFLFRLALRLDMFARRVVIVGTPADAAETRAAIARVRTGFFRVVGVAAPDDAASLAPAALRGQERAAFSLVLTQLALDLDPDNAALRLLIADLHESRAKPELALAQLNAIPAKDPLIALVLLRQASLTDRLGNGETALKLLDQIAQAAPDRPEIPTLQGDLLRQKKKFSEAIAAYDATAY